MRRTHGIRTALASILSTSLVAGPAVAAPVVDLSWDSCSPIVVAKVPVPGQTVSTLYGSVTGMDEPHRLYTVNFWFASEQECSQERLTSTPDAWRFDPAGCQSPGSARIEITSSDPACPALAGAGTSFSILDLSHSPDDSLTPSGAMRATISVAYSSRPQTPEPGVRYQLFRVEFDHSASVAGAGTPGVTCGGFDSPVCFALWSGFDHFAGGCWMTSPYAYGAYYMTPEGVEKPMARGQGHASFGLEPGTAFSCFEAVPAQNATWGQIKAQYR